MSARSFIAAAGMIALLTLGACSPVPKVVDTPKPGEHFALSIDQPMQVRWANIRPEEGSWVLEKGPATAALSSKGRTVQPPANGAQQLEIFDFAGAQKGADELTFVYKRADGQPPTADDRITIAVTVG